MSLNLGRAPGRYEAAEQDRMREALRREDRRALKRGQDIELVTERLILTAPDGGQFVLGVDNAGTLTATPL